MMVKELSIREINETIHRELIEHAAEKGFKGCKIKPTIHRTTIGLFYHKDNYICEINEVTLDNRRSFEYNKEIERCKEWINNYIHKYEQLYRPTGKFTKIIAFIKALFSKPQKTPTNQAGEKVDFANEENLPKRFSIADLKYEADGVPCTIHQRMEWLYNKIKDVKPSELSPELQKMKDEYNELAELLKNNKKEEPVMEGGLV